KYSELPKVGQISEAISNKINKISINGLAGSSTSFVVQALFEKSDKPFLLIFQNKEEAAYYLNDLEGLIGEKDVLFFPSSHRRPYQIEDVDNANVLLRAEVLNRINSRKKPCIIVTYPEALFEKVVTRKQLDRNTLKMGVGDSLSIDFINETLFEYNFKRVDFVSEPGEFSVRGGIIDVFSFSNDNPYRIEFFGNEVDSIRSFDVETQLSVEPQKKITIIPNIENKFTEEKRESFLEYISDKTVIFAENTELLTHQLDKVFEKAKETFAGFSSDIKHQSPDELFLSKAEFLDRAELFTYVELSGKPVFDIKAEFQFNTRPQPSFNKQFDLLRDNLIENQKLGYTNFLFSSSEAQSKRFDDIFQSISGEDNEEIGRAHV